MINLQQKSHFYILWALSFFHNYKIIKMMILNYFAKTFVKTQMWVTNVQIIILYANDSQ